MRVKLSLAALLITAIVATLLLNTPRYRATVTNMTGYCRDVEPQQERLEGAERQVYSKTSQRSLYLHIFRPQSSNGKGTAAMLLFGGGWREGDIGSLAPLAKKLANDGHVVVLPDYRVRCRDGSSIADSIQDSEAAYAWMIKHAGPLGIDPARVIVGGESAGGHLALMTALQGAGEPAPAALLLFNPVVDLAALSTQLWLDRAIAKKFSPHLKPLHALPPTLIFHGTADSRVPIDSVRQFCIAAKSAGRACHLVKFGGLDHGFLHLRKPGSGNRSSPFDTVVAQTLRLLDDLTTAATE